MNIRSGDIYDVNRIVILNSELLTSMSYCRGGINKKIRSTYGTADEYYKI